MRRGVRPTPEWVESRIPLFEQFLAATTNAQTSRRFTHLLCLDATLAADWGPKFARMLEGPSVVVETGERWVDGVTAHLRGSVRGPLISTALDSDDGIASDFIERVQEEIRPDRGLNFVDGVQYSIEERRFVRRAYLSNPFISMHSSRGDWVLRASGHHKVAKRLEVDDIRSDPMWLQVVHDGNISNALSPRARPCRSALARERFQVEFGSTQSVAGFIGSMFRFRAHRSLVLPGQRAMASLREVSDR